MKVKKAGNDNAKINYGEATTIGCYIIATITTRNLESIPPGEPFKSLPLEANSSPNFVNNRNVVKFSLLFLNCKF